MEKLKRNATRVSYLFVCGLWALLLLFMLFTFSHGFVVISGDSMEPTLHNHEIVLASKCTSVNVGDIYVVREPAQGQRVIKRLLGGPGDTVEFVDGALYRNGDLIQEAPGNSWDNYVFELSGDEYLFVGDNRAESYDGRHWERRARLDEIEYHLEWVLYPFAQFGKVDKGG